MAQREILFKARRTDNGEWVEGDVVTDIEGNPVAIAGYDNHTAKLQFEIDPETLCQYTGLLDKNGAKIFEWDKGSHPDYGIGFVEWNNQNSDFGIYPTSDTEDDGSYPFFVSGFFANAEITGNIHD